MNIRVEMRPGVGPSYWVSLNLRSVFVNVDIYIYFSDCLQEQDLLFSLDYAPLLLT